MSEVYVVIGGYAYAGDYFDTLKVFDADSWDAADAYREELCKCYDYSKMQTRLIEK